MAEETMTAVAEAPSAGAGAAAATSVTGAAPPPETGQETRETAPSTVDTQAAETQQETTPAGEPSQPDTDTRVIPLKWREAFSKDRDLRNLFFNHREFNQVFPGGVPEARTFKETFENAGGTTGIAQMQTDLSDFKTVAQQFLDGDENFAADLFKEDPLAASSHAPHFLKHLRASDEPSYNRLTARQFAEEFQAAGVRPLIEQAYALIREGKTQEALGSLEKLAGWHDNVLQVAKQEDDPRFKKLQEQLKHERTERANTEAQGFFSSYRQEVSTQNTATANKLLDDYLRTAPANMKPDDRERKLLLKNAIVEANDVLVADREFAKQRDALIARRDMNSLRRFVESRWEQELKKSVALVMRTFGKGWSKTTPAPAGSNGQQRTPQAPPAPEGFTPVSKRPDGNLIDWGQTSGPMVLQERKAVLKDGKKVTWAALE